MPIACCYSELPAHFLVDTLYVSCWILFPMNIYLGIILDHKRCSSVVFYWLKYDLSFNFILRVKNLWHGLKTKPLKCLSWVQTCGLSFDCLEIKAMFLWRYLFFCKTLYPRDVASWTDLLKRSVPKPDLLLLLSVVTIFISNIMSELT